MPPQIPEDISKKSTKELVAIVNFLVETEDDTTIDAAEAELNRREVSEKELHELATEILQEIDEEEDRKARIERIGKLRLMILTKDEGYPVITKLGIFCGAPFLIFGDFKPGLIGLYKQKQKRKFKQRLLLLIGGCLAWGIYFYLEYYFTEQKRKQEIKSIDMSEWEKTYYGYNKDSLKNNKTVQY